MVFQPQCRRMMLADGRKREVGAIQADDRDLGGLSIHDRHVHHCGFAPEAEQAPASHLQFARRKCPDRSIDHHARPRAVLPDLAALQRQIDQRRHVNSSLSKELSHVLEPDHQRGGKINPGAHTSARCANIGIHEASAGACLPRGSPKATLVRRNIKAPKASKPEHQQDREQRHAAGRTHDEKLS